MWRSAEAWPMPGRKPSPSIQRASVRHPKQWGVYERGGLGAHQEYSQRASGGSQGLPYTQKGRWRGVGEPERQTMGRGAQMGRGLEAFPTTQRQYRRSKGPEVSSTRQWQYQAQYAQNTQTHTHTQTTWRGREGMACLSFSPRQSSANAQKRTKSTHAQTLPHARGRTHDR